ncbi:hypothetical protein ACP4OV_015039 [Aristida adscensionis]
MDQPAARGRGSGGGGVINPTPVRMAPPVETHHVLNEPSGGELPSQGDEACAFLLVAMLLNHTELAANLVWMLSEWKIGAFDFWVRELRKCGEGPVVEAVVYRLLDKGLDCLPQLAAIHGSEFYMKRILVHCDWVDWHTELFGSTAVHFAVVGRNPAEMLRILLRDVCDAASSAKSDINRSDTRGRTPLMLASIKGRGNIVKVLLDKYAKPDLADLNGKTAIELAAEGIHSCQNAEAEPEAMTSFRDCMEALLPVTIPLPTYENWTVDGIIEHVKEKLEVGLPQPVSADQSIPQAGTGSQNTSPASNPSAEVVNTDSQVKLKDVAGFLYGNMDKLPTLVLAIGTMGITAAHGQSDLVEIPDILFQIICAWTLVTIHASVVLFGLTVNHKDKDGKGGWLFTVVSVLVFGVHAYVLVVASAVLIGMKKANATCIKSTAAMITICFVLLWALWKRRTQEGPMQAFHLLKHKQAEDGVSNSFETEKCPSMCVRRQYVPLTDIAPKGQTPS